MIMFAVHGRNAEGIQLSACPVTHLDTAAVGIHQNRERFTGNKGTRKIREQIRRAEEEAQRKKEEEERRAREEAEAKAREEARRKKENSFWNKAFKGLKKFGEKMIEEEE